jgi:hypothetical protein
MVGIPGRNGTWYGFLRRFFKDDLGHRTSRRKRSAKDIADCGGRDEKVQKGQLIGHSNTTPMDVGPSDFPNDGGNLLRRFVGGDSGRRTLIVNLVQPAVESRPGDTEVLTDSAPRNLKSFNMPKNQKPFWKTVSRIFVTPADSFLKDRNLQSKFMDLVSQKNNFLNLGIDIHGGKTD